MAWDKASKTALETGRSRVKNTLRVVIESTHAVGSLRMLRSDCATVQSREGADWDELRGTDPLTTPHTGLRARSPSFPRVP